MSPMISNSSSKDRNFETINKEMANEKRKLLKLSLLKRIRFYVQNTGKVILRAFWM